MGRCASPPDWVWQPRKQVGERLPSSPQVEKQVDVPPACLPPRVAPRSYSKRSPPSAAGQRAGEGAGGACSTINLPFCTLLVRRCRPPPLASGIAIKVRKPPADRSARVSPSSATRKAGCPVAQSCKRGPADPPAVTAHARATPCVCGRGGGWPLSLWSCA
jgi:hypothetical protein